MRFCQASSPGCVLCRDPFWSCEVEKSLSEAAFRWFPEMRCLFGWTQRLLDVGIMELGSGQRQQDHAALSRRSCRGRISGGPETAQLLYGFSVHQEAWNEHKYDNRHW
mmetsp:Transcript_17057/g.39427  ORF Transcript_17057/g.39427 Transcript_17057/m.39427 type:complete len:108 (+) Transcript_17057:649-972(+)